jgi:hypothetical protein
MMLRRAALAAMAAVSLAGALALGGEPLKSGPQVGERVGPFDVLDVTGPNKGKTLCYV